MKEARRIALIGAYKQHVSLPRDIEQPNPGQGLSTMGRMNQEPDQESMAIMICDKQQKLDSMPDELDMEMDRITNDGQLLNGGHDV